MRMYYIVYIGGESFLSVYFVSKLYPVDKVKNLSKVFFI